MLGESGVIHDHRFDRAKRLDLRQHHLAYFGQHGLVRPRGVGNEMQQRLVFGRSTGGCGQRGHRLDALALAGQQQPGAVVVQRFHPVGMADDADQLVDVGFEVQATGGAFQKIHDCLTAWARIFIVYEIAPIREKLNFATQ